MRKSEAIKICKKRVYMHNIIHTDFCILCFFGCQNQADIQTTLLRSSSPYYFQQFNTKTKSRNSSNSEPNRPTIIISTNLYKIGNHEDNLENIKLICNNHKYQGRVNEKWQSYD